MRVQARTTTTTARQGARIRPPNQVLNHSTPCHTRYSWSQLLTRASYFLCYIADNHLGRRHQAFNEANYLIRLGRMAPIACLYVQVHLVGRTVRTCEVESVCTARSVTHPRWRSADGSNLRAGRGPAIGPGESRICVSYINKVRCDSIDELSFIITSFIFHSFIHHRYNKLCLNLKAQSRLLNCRIPKPQPTKLKQAGKS